MARYSITEMMLEISSTTAMALRLRMILSFKVSFGGSLKMFLIGIVLYFGLF